MQDLSLFLPSPSVMQDLSLFLPSPSVMQDLSPALALARQRCRDDKGLVRKAALGLLESLLLLRGSLPSPMGMPPGPEDVLAIEAAAVDPLVGG